VSQDRCVATDGNRPGLPRVPVRSPAETRVDGQTQTTTSSSSTLLEGRFQGLRELIDNLACVHLRQVLNDRGSGRLWDFDGTYMPADVNVHADQYGTLDFDRFRLAGKALVWPLITGGLSPVPDRFDLEIDLNVAPLHFDCNRAPHGTTCLPESNDDSVISHLG